MQTGGGDCNDFNNPRDSELETPPEAESADRVCAREPRDKLLQTAQYRAIFRSAC